MLGMLLVLCAVLFLWISFGRDSAEAAAPEPTEPAVMLRASAAMLPGGGETQAEATPEPTVQPTPEPVLTPPGSGAFAASARPDGNAVTPKDDLCYWGMELLDAGAQAHRCRFVSGSGSLLLRPKKRMEKNQMDKTQRKWNWIHNRKTKRKL